ncbi:chromomethylase-like protein, partial [Genlisea aurea]
EVVQAKRHFYKARLDDVIYAVGDDAYVKAEPGRDNYICKIIEFFQAEDGSKNFTAQWYYRAEDT